LVEADFYNGALKDPAAAITALKSRYSLAFQDEVLMTFAPMSSSLWLGTDLTLRLAIPTVANRSNSVTVFVTNAPLFGGAVCGVYNPRHGRSG
jgi:hypothetical protein